MSTEASAALGTVVLAGCFVSPKGLTKNITGATAAGMVTGIAGRAVADRVLSPGGAPSFGSVGYVAATAVEVAVIKGKAGAFKPKVSSEVVARAPRSDVTGVELDAHMLTATLTITFGSGEAWQFEVPKAHRGAAQQLVAVLADRAG